MVHAAAPDSNGLVHVVAIDLEASDVTSSKSPTVDSKGSETSPIVVDGSQLKSSGNVSPTATAVSVTNSNTLTSATMFNIAGIANSKSTSNEAHTAKTAIRMTPSAD